MGSIQLGGIATGLDTNSLIQQLLAVERQPVTTLQTRKLKYQAISAAFQALNTRLAAVKTKADALRDSEGFFARSVTSSEDTVATATAGVGNVQGTYTVTVAGLAKGSIAAATTTKSATTDTIATADGDFQFRLGATGAVVSVAVTGTTTLDDFVTAVNDADAGVRAQLVNTGTSAAPAWKVTLTSVSTGSDNDIVIVDDVTTLGIANTQTATDATFSITGLGSFTRATNTFSDVLDDVTFTLKAAGSTDLAVGYDKAATQTRLQGLLDAYNDVVRAIDTQTAATIGSDGTVTPGAFTGDATTRQIRTALASAIGRNLGGTVAALADLGVTTQKDGTLELDQAEFQDAVTTDPDAVRQLVAGTSSLDGIADLAYAAADAATKALTGTIAVRQDGLTATMRSIQSQIDAAQARLETTEKTLRARFNHLEQIVAGIQSSGASLVSQLQRITDNGNSR